MNTVVVDVDVVEVVVDEVVVLVVVLVVVVVVLVVVGVVVGGTVVGIVVIVVVVGTSVTVVNVVVGFVLSLLQTFIANSTNVGFSLFSVFVISTIIFVISTLWVRESGLKGDDVVFFSFNMSLTSYKLTVYSSTFVFVLTSWIFLTSTVISLTILNSIVTFDSLKLNPPLFGKSLSGYSNGDVIISETYCEFPTIWTYSQSFLVVVDVVLLVVVLVVVLVVEEVVVGVTVVGIFVVVIEVWVVGSTYSVVVASVVGTSVVLKVEVLVSVSVVFSVVVDVAVVLVGSTQKY